MTELLAPAGSIEAFRAAVESGANAVYLAGNQFGARAYAANFDEEGLREAIRYAHLHGVHVHVTVNTIVDDKELPALRSYLRFLYEAGADAVLIQDLGVARVVKETVPDMPMHASTQMSVHNLAGVERLTKLGFSRVVLARELSLADIRHICAHSKVEIEVFIHGAICVCYSGQCLMSSIIGGRSGNRGRCAQPCRLPYTLVDENGRDVLNGQEGEYLLSPKDMNTIDILPELVEAGVASLKIEGRMKRPEYVAVVVDTYRRALDSMEEGYFVSESDHRALAQIFNRDFTTAYLEGRPGKEMMSSRRPNNRGLLVGRVAEYSRDTGRVTLKLSDTLSLGDQVDFWVKVGGRITTDIVDMKNKQGKNVDYAEAGDEVTFSVKGNVRVHDRVFKVYDQRLMKYAKAFTQEGNSTRRVPVYMQVDAAVKQPLTLMVSDYEGHSARVTTEFIGQKAQNRPLTKETLHKQLSRLGNTVFELKELDADIQENVMVPISELNEARRKAITALEEAMLADYKRPEISGSVKNPGSAKDGRIRSGAVSAELVVSTDTLEGVETAFKNGANRVVFGGDSYSHVFLGEKYYRSAKELADKYNGKISFNTPRIIREQHVKIFKSLIPVFAELKPESVYVHNIGTVEMLSEPLKEAGVPLWSDYSLISYNVEALRELQSNGIQGAVLSPELTLSQVKQLASESPIQLECIADGYLELMVSEYCAVGSFLGNIHKGECSGICRKGHNYFLKDRKNALFPLIFDQFCHMHVLNSKKLSMLPHAMCFGQMGIGSIRIEGKGVASRELANTIRSYKKYMSMKEELSDAEIEKVRGLEGDITRGHYFRGVL